MLASIGSLASDAFTRALADALMSSIPARADERATSFFAAQNGIAEDTVTRSDIETELNRCTPWT